MTHAQTRAHTAACRFPADHPAFAGHFPGNPVVPGVLLLDRVIEVAESWLGHGLHVRALRQAKFLAPLRPGEPAQIELAFAGDTLEFGIRRDAADIARGCFVLDPADGP